MDTTVSIREFATARECGRSRRRRTHVLRVPYCDPLIVFAPPGFVVTAAIRLGYIVGLGSVFRSWAARPPHRLG
jgi:hypothetical protein